MVLDTRTEQRFFMILQKKYPIDLLTVKNERIFLKMKESKREFSIEAKHE